MSKLAYVFYVYNIYKHFNICCFRALACTTLDRLRAVLFLCNVCCFNEVWWQDRCGTFSNFYSSAKRWILVRLMVKTCTVSQKAVHQTYGHYVCQLLTDFQFFLLLTTTHFCFRRLLTTSRELTSGFAFWFPHAMMHFPTKFVQILKYLHLICQCWHF